MQLHHCAELIASYKLCYGVLNANDKSLANTIFAFGEPTSCYRITAIKL